MQYLTDISYECRGSGSGFAHVVGVRAVVLFHDMFAKIFYIIQCKSCLSQNLKNLNLIQILDTEHKRFKLESHFGTSIKKFNSEYIPLKLISNILFSLSFNHVD